MPETIDDDLMRVLKWAQDKVAEDIESSSEFMLHMHLIVLVSSIIKSRAATISSETSLRILTGRKIASPQEANIRTMDSARRGVGS
jgi:hypothetical protein